MSAKDPRALINRGRWAARYGVKAGRTTQELFAVLTDALEHALDRAEKAEAEVNRAHDAEIAACLRAEKAEQAQTWRPIESAPKDGTWILAGYDWPTTHKEDPHSVVLRWSDEEWRDGNDKGWCTPTHWQPLPAPPKETP